MSTTSVRTESGHYLDSFLVKGQRCVLRLRTRQRLRICCGCAVLDDIKCTETLLQSHSGRVANPGHTSQHVDGTKCCFRRGGTLPFHIIHRHRMDNQACNGLP